MPEWVKRRKKAKASSYGMRKGRRVTTWRVSPSTSIIDDVFDAFGSLRISRLIPGFVVLLVGFSLIGPMSDAITNAGNGSENIFEEEIIVTEEDTLNYNGPPRPPAPVENNNDSPNVTNDLWNPFNGMVGLLGNKFFLFLMFVVGPFMMWKAMARSGGMGY